MWRNTARRSFYVPEPDTFVQLPRYKRDAVLLAVQPHWSLTVIRGEGWYDGSD